MLKSQPIAIENGANANAIIRDMIKLPKKKSLIIVISLIVVAATGSMAFLNMNSREPSRGPKPQSKSESQFLYQEVYYNCSRDISGEWKEAWVGNPGRPGYYFVPDRESDLDRYCRVNSVIEYRAVIDILRREDVSSVIAKYDTTEAWVKALGHTYIHDKAYLKRILPKYSTMKIDCIIVVHSPEGTRFFIENGEKHESHLDHQYIEVPAAEFLASLNNAPDADVTNFWLGLH